MESLINKITNGRWQDYADSIPDKSIDAIIVDPPYGIGMGEWDVLDIAEYITFVNRVCKKFFAFFGQFPTLNDWFNECKKFDFKYLEHISWVKRMVNPAPRLSRGHEEIIIFGLNGHNKFEKTKGIYEDVKVPGLQFDCVSLESIKRHISRLRQELKTGRPVVLDSVRKHQKEYDRFGKKEHLMTPDFINYTNVWSFLVPTHSKRDGQYLHPTAKPLEVIKRLVEMLTKEDDVVLDNYSGSGTLAHACIELKRNFICFEACKEYYDKSLDRIKSVIEQGVLF